MSVLVVAGFVLTVTMFIVMARINLLRFLGYSTLVDVSFTIIMFLMFAETFSGVVAGSFAGMFMAGGLSMGRRLFGYERLERKGLLLKWVYHKPTWVLPGITERFARSV